MPMMPGGNFVPQSVLQGGGGGSVPPPSMPNVPVPPQAQLNAQAAGGPGQGGAATAQGVQQSAPPDAAMQMTPGAGAPAAGGQGGAVPPGSPPAAAAAPGMAPAPVGWHPNPQGLLLYPEGQGPVTGQVQPTDAGEMSLQKVSGCGGGGRKGKPKKDSRRKMSVDVLAKINLQHAAQRSREQRAENDEDGDEGGGTLSRAGAPVTGGLPFNKLSEMKIQRPYSTTQAGGDITPGRWQPGHRFQGVRRKSMKQSNARGNHELPVVQSPVQTYQGLLLGKAAGSCGGGKKTRGKTQSKKAMNRSAVGESGLSMIERPWSLQGSDAWPSKNEMWSSAKKWDSSLPPGSKPKMKVALSETAQGFLDRCLERQLSEPEIFQAVKQASEISPVIAADLEPLLKLAGPGAFFGKMFRGGKNLWDKGKAPIRRFMGRGGNAAGEATNLGGRAGSMRPLVTSRPMMTPAPAPIPSTPLPRPTSMPTPTPRPPSSLGQQIKKPVKWLMGGTPTANVTGGALAGGAYGGIEGYRADTNNGLNPWNLNSNTALGAATGAVGGGLAGGLAGPIGKSLGKVSPKPVQGLMGAAGGLAAAPTLYGVGKGLVDNTVGALTGMNQLDQVQKDLGVDFNQLIAQNPETGKYQINPQALPQIMSNMEPGQLGELMQGLEQMPPELQMQITEQFMNNKPLQDMAITKYLEGDPQMYEMAKKYGLVGENGMIDSDAAKAKIGETLQMAQKFEDHPLRGLMGQFMEMSPLQQMMMAGGVLAAIFGLGGMAGGSTGLGIGGLGTGLLLGGLGAFGPQLMPGLFGGSQNGSQETQEGGPPPASQGSSETLLPGPHTPPGYSEASPAAGISGVEPLPVLPRHGGGSQEAAAQQPTEAAAPATVGPQPGPYQGWGSPFHSGIMPRPQQQSLPPSLWWQQG